MDEIIRSIVVSIIITGIVEIFVFILTHYWLELVIKPKDKYRQLKKEILFAIEYYSNLITNPFVVRKEFAKEDLAILKTTDYPKMGEELRKLGCKIAIVKFKKQDNKKVKECLIRLSNSIWRYNDDRKEECNRRDIATIREILAKK